MSKLFFSLVFCIFYISVVYGCTPIEPAPELEEKIHYADAVIVGTVTEVIRPDPLYPQFETAYAVKMNIDCVYKGKYNDISQTMTIHGAGKLLIIIIVYYTESILIAERDQF